MPISELIVHIPLDRAMLCLNESCEAVFEVGPERCPACTDGAIISVRDMIEHTGLRWTENHHGDLERVR